jgi:G3E family GTPase
MNQIPVTVVTGFLGAGKTTLVNRLLADLVAQGSARSYAVIVNEFGDIGIDGDLIAAGEEELIELSSGCICCVVRGDLIRTMRSLLSRGRDLEGILIETTGLANPSPVIQTLVIDQVIGAQCRLDSVVCVVDAAHILDRLADTRDAADAADQIAFSDHILLNKADDTVVPLSNIETRLRTLNPFALITRANRADVPAEAVLNRNGFELDRIEGRLPELEDDHEDDHDHDHDHHSHIDASGIESLSISTDEPLDGDRLEEWMQDVLARWGANILRTKGILSVAGEDRKLVLQAVNMMLEGDFIDEWGSKPRRSRLVFIGRQLERRALEEGFKRCRQAAAFAS